MKNETNIPVKSLIAHILYTIPDPVAPETINWKGRGEVHNMTFEQVKTMFNQHPAYKDWLMPPEEVVKLLGLEEHYAAIQAKYAKIRKNNAGWWC